MADEAYKGGVDLVLPKIHNFEPSPEPLPGEDLVAHSFIDWDCIAPKGAPPMTDISFGTMPDGSMERNLPTTDLTKWKPVKNRVMVGSVLYPVVNWRPYAHHMEFIYRCGRRCLDYEFILSFATRSEIDRARNRLVHNAIMLNCEFLYFYDTDTHMPSDLMSRMLEVMDIDENITSVSPLYHVRGYPFPVMAFKESQYKPEMATLKEVKKDADKDGLYDCWGLGCGTTMTRVSSYAQWNGPWYRTSPNHTEDAWFCSFARKFNSKARFVIDTTMEAGHELIDPIVVRSSNVKHLKKMLGPGGWHPNVTE